MLTDSLRDIATNHGWQVCDEAADEIERLERELLARSDYELGKNDGWEACETCHGIVDGISPHRRAIEDEVLQAQEPVAFPDLPAGIVLHSQLGELYDRLQVQQYALRYADASAPQPPAPCPDCEGRANGYSVLVPSAGLKELQAKVAELEKDAARYQYMRRLNVPMFKDLFVASLSSGIPFDSMIDAAIAKDAQ